MAAQQSQGISTLLEAEKEAAKIVQKARTYRTQKLKDARTEAAKEIDEIKAKKEQEFHAFQKEHEGSSTTLQTSTDKETDETLKEITAAFKKNESNVVKKLLHKVTDVQPELHRNLKRAA